MRQLPDYRVNKPGITERRELSIIPVHIEMCSKDRLPSGPKYSVSELKKKLARILAGAEAKDFTSIFCARYDFEEMPLDNVPINESIEVNYYIDIDAGLIHEPSH